MKPSRTLFGSLLLSITLLAVFALHAQQPVIEATGANQIEAGGPISLHVKFDKPLPESASVRVEVSPQATTQWIAFSTGDPDNPSRTAFTVKGKLPDNAVPGTWTVRNVWLFLPGSVQGQSLGQNNATFQVKGKEFPIPSKAEIAVTK
jgi:hypothetical protein